MAEECFCGCGRRVKFGDRGMNKNGKRTSELLARLRDTRSMLEERGPLGPGGDNKPSLARYETMIAEGEGYEQAWEDVVHLGVDGMRPKQALAFKREFSEWGRGALEFDSMIQRLAALSPEELAEVRRGLDQSE